MKALVFYSATGQGFKSPADAIVRELEKRGVEAESIDFFDAIGMRISDWLIKNGWNLCLRQPWIFRIAYPATDSLLIAAIFAIPMPSFKKKMAEYMATRQVDFIVSTHYASTWFLARYEPVAAERLPFFGYNSDVLLSHRAYIQKNARAYFISTEQGKRLMVAQGMREEAVRITGFPIDPKYKKTYPSIAKMREELGLADVFTLLLSFGGEGVGDIQLVELIAERGAEIQVIAVCGRNEAITVKLMALKNRYPKLRLTVLGFTTRLQDYLFACDISAGKAGLNTVFESIFLKRPFLVLRAMANELHCARFVVERGYGLHPKNVLEALAFIEGARRGSQEFKRMRQALETPPCNYEIGDMIETMKDITNETTKERVRAAKYLLFDLAGTLCDIPIGDKWERVNHEGISKVLDLSGYTESFGEPAREKLAGRFVAEKHVFRKEAKTSLREYEIRGQILGFFDALAAEGGPVGAFFAKADRGAAILERFEAAFVQPELDITVPFPEAPAILAVLAEKKPLYLLSNNVSRGLVESILEKCGIASYFTAIIVSSEIGYRKPHESFASNVLEFLHAKPSECVMIGDRLSQDIKMAVDFGMCSIHAAMVEHEDNVGAEHIRADLTIHALSELPSLLL